MKRSTLVIIITLIVLTAFVAIFAYINQEKLIDRFVQNRANNSWRIELLEDPEQIKLITIGTSAELPSERAQTCNVVIVNGEVLIFDLGQGSLSNLEDLRIPFLETTKVFISRWHSDHFIDLPAFVNRGWLLGRPQPLTIYGPKGVFGVANGIDSLLSYENQLRVIQHGKDNLNIDNMRITPQLIDCRGVEKIVYEYKGITVSAIEIKYQGEGPSLAYKIEYAGKKLVISGDTAYDERIAKFASGADILLHEAMEKDLVQRASRLQSESGNDRNAKLLNDLLQYHSTPQEAAQIAAIGKVKKLILSSLSPPPENPISRRVYRQGLEEFFSGPVVLAEDGDIYKIE